MLYWFVFQKQDWGYMGVFLSTDSWLMCSSSASGTKSTSGKIVTSTYQCIFLFSQKHFSYFQQLPIYQLSTWNLLPSFWFSCLYSSSVQWLSHVWLFATLELQHARFPCPSPTPGACSNSCPSSQWCHPTISSSAILFSSCL